MRKMTANNPNADLVIIKSYRKFGQNLSIFLKILNRNEILALIKGHDSGTNVRKMMCNNPNVDIVNMNAYIKFGEILAICSQNIEWKRNFGLNQWPQLWYKSAKNDV